MLEDHLYIENGFASSQDHRPKPAGNSTFGPYTWPANATTSNWQWPVSVYPYVAQPQEDYANELEVEEREHDATLRFWRVRGGQRTLAKEVTVPLALLEEPRR